jgi:hypothetical protein
MFARMIAQGANQEKLRSDGVVVGRSRASDKIEGEVARAQRRVLGSSMVPRQSRKALHRGSRVQAAGIEPAQDSCRFDAFALAGF